MLPKRLATLVWICALCLAVCLPRPAHADGGLDLTAELLRPGVRLLAIEFYATWCKPCMEAVPRWKALHDKYRDKGLRLVVIAVQDDGRCINPGWNPDRMVCDEDGRFSEAFRVGQNLPAAFLWSWTGKLLVQRGTVAQVGTAIDAELASLPRVTLGADPALAHVIELLRAELRRSGKLDVLATVDEEKVLADVRRESQKAGYAENTQCKLGEQIAANSLLKVSIQRRSTEPKLLLQLLSAEKGCLTQSGLAPWNPGKADVAVATAVADLLDRLRVETQMPGQAATRTVAAKETTFTGPEPGRQAGGDDTPIVAFESQPTGAQVELDGQVLCDAAPCKRAIPKGRHRVRMSKARFLTQEEAVQVAEGTNVAWKLEANTAKLHVETTEPGVAVSLDGDKIGNSPLDLEVPVGRHRVELASACHVPAGAEMTVARGDVRNVALKSTPRLAGLRVEAADGKGDVAEGEVWLDGRKVGATWQNLTVPLCGRKVVVMRDGKVVWQGEAGLKEKELSKLAAVVGYVREARIRLISGRYAVQDDGTTVKDTRTGLVWQRRVDGQEFTWAAGKAYCQSQSAAGGAMRLPEKDELLGLVVKDARPTIDAEVFLDTPAQPFWTATSRDSGGQAWYVNFIYGYSNFGDTSIKSWVRCVR